MSGEVTVITGDVRSMTIRPAVSFEWLPVTRPDLSYARRWSVYSPSLRNRLSTCHLVVPTASVQTFESQSGLGSRENCTRATPV